MSSSDALANGGVGMVRVALSASVLQIAAW